MTTQDQLNHLLSELKQLDPNGWATLTDGTMDDETLDEQITIVREAIAFVLENS